MTKLLEPPTTPHRNTQIKEEEKKAAQVQMNDGAVALKYFCVALCFRFANLSCVVIESLIIFFLLMIRWVSLNYIYVN